MSSLTGNSHRLGDTGENFVKRRMSTLNLGVYEDESSNPNAGYADGTWRFDYVEERCIPPIICLCEIKNEEEISNKDIDKFCKIDVPAAQNLGKNWGVFISLRRRLAGRPSISIDKRLGIPIMCISRDCTDSISAEKVIEMAFHTIVELWPMMQKDKHGEGVDSVLSRVSEHLDIQREEIEKMNKQVLDMERCGNQILKRANTMKSIQEGLMKGILHLRNADVRLCVTNFEERYEFWENEGLELKKAVRSHHDRFSRHPSSIKDLKLDEDLEKVIEKIPQAFRMAVDSVKSDIQKEASLKRSRKRNLSNANNDTECEVSND